MEIQEQGIIGGRNAVIEVLRSGRIPDTVYIAEGEQHGSTVKVARVPNLAACIRELKSQGIWIYGAEMEGERFDRVDFSGAVALVIGSEGRGLSRLVRESCDFLVTLPMNGQINSLNASVAAGILMYEVVRQRL